MPIIFLAKAMFLENGQNKDTMRTTDVSDFLNFELGKKLLFYYRFRLLTVGATNFTITVFFIEIEIPSK